jgi:hypothetical protein
MLNHIFVLLFLCLCLFGCERRYLQGQNDKNAFHYYSQDARGLTPKQKYAGEILSYLIKVVCGTDGPIKNRNEWKSAGLDTPLDFNYVSEIMDHTGRSKKEVLSLDANILGLSKTLYSYNPQFNLFKGNSILESVYPSSELIALRLFLIKRVHRNEKINLPAIVEQKSIFMNPSTKATPTQLRQTRLSRQELAFLQSIFNADPLLWQYLEHPFIVKTLLEMNVVENDPDVLSLANNATYKGCLRQIEKKLPHSMIRIAVLPSFISGFENGQVSANPCKKEFIAPTSYLNVVEKLKTDIVANVGEKIAEVNKSQNNKCVDTVGNTEKEIRDYIDQNVSYEAFTGRPLMIYPGNIEAIKKDLCRDIDMTIVLLGKDVYLSIQFNENEPSPDKNHIFIDFSDTKYALISDELDFIGESIASKIMDHCLSEVE